MTWTIRSAGPDDRDEILRVVAAAFTSQGHDPTEEVDIVVRTWERQACPADLEIVAIAPNPGAGDEAGPVVGHVMAAIGDLAGRPAIGVAPLSVAPGFQRQGVGSALVAELLHRVEGNGWPFVLLLGDPAYYGRFGFEPAAAAGISYAPAGTGNPNFMLRRLSSPPAEIGGEYRYCWEMGGQPSA